MSCSLEMKEKDLYPVWNAEFIVSKDKNTNGNMLGFPIQNKKLLNFQHFQVLSAFDVKLDLEKIDPFGIHNYCDGSKRVKEILEVVLAENSNTTEEILINSMNKMERMGIISLLEK